MDTEPRPPPPSFPSAQAIDETFSHSRTCKIVSDSHSQPRQQMASSSAGKGKANHTFSEDEKDVFDDTPDEMYSASADLAAETRRVEETLRRWEVEERRRRKAARESTQSTTAPSLLENVTRSASLVLSGRHSRARSGTGHRVLKSVDSGDGVPLNDICQQPHSNAQFTPSSNARIDNDSKSNTQLANPFVHPYDALTSSPSPPLSPFTDSISRSPLVLENGSPSITYPTVVAGQRIRNQASPPTSPTPTTPRVPITMRNRPLQPTPVPAINRVAPRAEEEPEVRWWHEWLCGCGEGPDRGGDHQAARTNPCE